MSFGGGGGWGGGGGGAYEEEIPIAIWGPPGSGAIITPGPEFPYEAIDKTKKVGILVLLLAVLALSRS